MIVATLEETDPANRHNHSYADDGHSRDAAHYRAFPLPIRNNRRDDRDQCHHIDVGDVVPPRRPVERRAITMMNGSQLVMLVLMVGYTTGSLWIIAQPIVEFGGG